MMILYQLRRELVYAHKGTTHASLTHARGRLGGVKDWVVRRSRDGRRHRSHETTRFTLCYNFIMKIDYDSASLILIDQEKVLMQLRDEKPEIAYPGCWCIPGGRVEKNESIEEAVKREIEEETGYLSRNPELFSSVICELPNGKAYRSHIFCEKYDGKQMITCREGQKMEFKSEKEMERLKVYPGQVEIIKKALELAKKEFNNSKT